VSSGSVTTSQSRGYDVTSLTSEHSDFLLVARRRSYLFVDLGERFPMHCVNVSQIEYKSRNKSKNIHIKRIVIEANMNKEEALKLIRARRVTVWNKYREEHPDWKPDLSYESLETRNLSPTIRSKHIHFNLLEANLCGTKLPQPSDYPGSRMTSVIKNAIFNADTVFPSGFDPVEHGAVFVTKSQLKRTDFGPIPAVFISYAWANDDVVLAIDQWLRNRGIKTKIDKRDFFAGKRIRDEIFRVMIECNVILVFHSQQSKDKPWPTFERELAEDIEMEAKTEGKTPPRKIYFVVDNTPLPGISEKNRIAIMAKGKKFEFACEELYHHILQLEREPEKVDIEKWKGYTF